MIQLLVIAKAPVPGHVKTRLCPPCTPEEAATIAEAALADTLETSDHFPVVRRIAVLEGTYKLPPGWLPVAQRGTGLAQRLAYAFTDTALPNVPTLLIGMDTPQITAAHLNEAAEALLRTGAVLGPSLDGGWWTLGLRDPYAAQVLPPVPMSTPDTAAATLAALRTRSINPFLLPTLRDVDTATDALEVASACPTSARFPAAVNRFLGPTRAAPSPVPGPAPAARSPLAGPAPAAPDPLPGPAPTAPDPLPGPVPAAGSHLPGPVAATAGRLFPSAPVEGRVR
ncbi:TIGR04282 family arsenosugar biosynthesis glycosyltransferase [Actinoplanes sp. CA-054009]